MDAHSNKADEARQISDREIEELGKQLNKGLKLSETPVTTEGYNISKSTKKLEQLCKSLENKLATKNHELELAFAEIAKLKGRKKDFKIKLKASMKKLDKTKNLRKKLAAADELSDRLQKENEGVKSVVEASEENLEETEKIFRLKTLLRESKKREKLIKPLLDIGVSIRLRFLQQARETIYNRRSTPAELKILNRSNEVAHRGNGLADAAVFKAQLTGEDHVLARVFRRLYRFSPTEYLDPNEVTMLSKVLDCQASVMVVQRVRATSASASLRGEHIRLTKRLLFSLKRSASIEIWEENSSNKE